MNFEKTNLLHQQLQDYLNSSKKRFEFEINYPLPERISSIYEIIFPGVQKYRFYLRFLLARIAQYIDYSPIKVFLYRAIGIKIGQGVFISPDVILDPHFPKLIEIGDYVILGWGAKLFTHEFSAKQYRLGRIIIEEGAIIGGFSFIRGGVTIGKHAEIIANGVVYKDVPDNTTFSLFDLVEALLTHR